MCSYARTQASLPGIKDMTKTPMLSYRLKQDSPVWIAVNNWRSSVRKIRENRVVRRRLSKKVKDCSRNETMGHVLGTAELPRFISSAT